MSSAGQGADRGAGRVIRVALAPDIPVVSAGLAALLTASGPDVSLVELPSGPTRLAPVDLVLYDPQHFHPPAPGGARGGRPLLVALSWSVRSDAVSAARDQGAAGYLSKELSGSEILASLRAIHAGARTPYVVSPHRPGNRSRRADGLTERELEILSMITEGHSNEEIARRLYLSINSVKTYIRTAYRKIGATRRPQAVLWGVEHGFAPPRRPDRPASV